MENEVNTEKQIVNDLLIEGNRYILQDYNAQAAISALIQSTLSNNTAISERINDLNNRITTIEHDKNKTPLVIVDSLDSTITIDPYKYYDFGTVDKKVTVNFNTSKEEAGFCKQYTIKFVADENCEIELPSTCIYENGTYPIFVIGHNYEFHINNGLVSIGEFYT